VPLATVDVDDYALSPLVAAQGAETAAGSTVNLYAVDFYQEMRGAMRTIAARMTASGQPSAGIAAGESASPVMIAGGENVDAATVNISLSQGNIVAIERKTGTIFAGSVNTPDPAYIYDDTNGTGTTDGVYSDFGNAPGSYVPATGVLAILITVVAIVLELSATRYTHRVTALFVRDPVNLAVMAFYVLTSVL
jgi:hypothetical protein